MRRPSLFGLVILLATVPAAGRAAVLDALFKPDQEACFGRIYDAGHLRAHPQQQVTSFHLLRALGDRKEAENPFPERKNQEIDQFKDGRVTVQAFVTFRKRKGHFTNTLSCHTTDKGELRCGVDCDGGAFVLTRTADNAVLLHNEGFVLIGGCGEDVASAEEVFLKPGKDDALFRLAREPVAACRAVQARTTPIRYGRGKPLIDRFAAGEAQCYGRDYDAAHLARHPEQRVASIRVERVQPKPRKPDTAPDDWPEVRLAVAATLRGQGGVRTARYECTPDTASWTCTPTLQPNGDPPCSSATISLARADGSDVMLFNRRSGLPLGACTPPGDAVTPTASDDRAFRLSRLPLSACH